MEIDIIIQKFGDPPPVLEIVESDVDGYKKTVYYTSRGEKVERWHGITGGHSIRVLRYNENDEFVMVHIDSSQEIMPKKEVLDYIKRNISDQQ